MSKPTAEEMRSLIHDDGRIERIDGTHWLAPAMVTDDKAFAGWCDVILRPLLLEGKAVFLKVMPAERRSEHYFPPAK